MKRILQVLALIGTSCVSPLAHAIPLTYTESAVASGSLGSQAFTNALITISATGDTSAVASSGSAYFIVLPTSLSIAGLGSTSFTDKIQFISNQNALLGGVGDATTNIGLLFTTNPFFATYNLASATAPITGAARFNFSAMYGTALGSLELTGVSGNSTFQASAPTALTPEPSTLLLLGTGALYLLWRGNRLPDAQASWLRA